MLVVVDLGYFNLKMVDESKEITILQNAYVNSFENDMSIPVNRNTKKITLQTADPVYGIVEQTRIYGENTCQMADHIQGISTRKVEEARFAFASVLSPKHNNQKLEVFCIHNERKDFPALETSILGHYKVVINNQMIQCEVVSCTCLYEGIGTYFYLQKDQPGLLTGSTRIFDLGFGLANDLILDENGEIQSYTTKPELSIFMLAKSIQTSQIFQHYMKDYSCNLASIGYALQVDKPLGAMPEEDWKKLKSYAITQYYKKLKTYITAPLANNNLFVNNYVLTGGGAAILDRENSNFRTVFTIPKNAGVASLIGILDYLERSNVKPKVRW